MDGGILVVYMSRWKWGRSVSRRGGDSIALSIPYVWRLGCFDLNSYELRETLLGLKLVMEWNSSCASELSFQGRK